MSELQAVTSAKGRPGSSGQQTVPGAEAHQQVATEKYDRFNNLRKSGFRRTPYGFLPERPPLCLLRAIPGELGSQTHGQLRWQHGGAAFECRPDGACEILTLELEELGEVPDVEVVLHPAVGHAELADRLELLRDGILPRVRAQTWLGKVKQRWEHQFGGIDRIAKSHVHLHSEHRSGERRPHLHPNPGILILSPYGIRMNGLQIEHHPVVRNFDRANLAKNLHHPGDGTIPKTKQVSVTGDTLGNSTSPCGQQHGALEDKVVAMPGAGQAVEPPLDAVPIQQISIRLPGFMGETQ